MIRVAEHGEDVLLRVQGSIDGITTRVLRDVLAWAVDHHRRVVVDLAAASSIDAAALDALVRAHQRAHSRAGHLRVVAFAHLEPEAR